MQFRIILTNSHTCLCAQSRLIFCDPLDCACQAPPLMGFPRQEYWSWLPFPFQGIYPIQGLNKCLLHLLYWQADSLPLRHLESPAPIQFCIKGNRVLRRQRKYLQLIKCLEENVLKEAPV